jgi:hypothetical protein
MNSSQELEVLLDAAKMREGLAQYAIDRSHISRPGPGSRPAMDRGLQSPANRGRGFRATLRGGLRMKGARPNLPRANSVGGAVWKSVGPPRGGGSQRSTHQPRSLAAYFGLVALLAPGIPAHAGDWPMHRGGPQLQGRTDDARAREAGSRVDLRRGQTHQRRGRDRGRSRFRRRRRRHHPRGRFRHRKGSCGPSRPRAASRPRRWFSTTSFTKVRATATFTRSKPPPAS